jgi:hypothetical protein
VNVGGLLGTILLNPAGLADRVVDEMHRQLSQRHALGDPDASTDDFVAAALGEWLARKFVGDSPQADRNKVLAAALGACGCWGEDPKCQLCAGAGAPGWTLPHRDLYAHYILPAVTAMTQGESTHA